MGLSKCLAAACVLAASQSVVAAPDHDPVLEEAAVRQAVSRLGPLPLRPGFASDEQPRFTRPASMSSDDEQSPWKDGLAPAMDLPLPASGRPST